MTSVLLSLLAVATGCSIFGTALVIKHLHNSPEGYEDENGFHFGRFAQEKIQARTQRAAAHLAEVQTAA